MRTKHEPAHLRTPDERRRRRLIWAAGGAAFATVAGAVVAFALLQLRADIEGGGTVSASPNIEFVSAIDQGGPADCTVSVSGGDLQLQVAGSPGEHCDISLVVARTGAAGNPQVIDGLDFSNQTSEGFTNGTCAWPGTVVTTAGTQATARITLTGAPGPFQALENAGLTTTDAPIQQGALVAGCPVA